MSFAGEDDLDGMVGVIEDAGETFGIAKQKSGAFVSGKAAGKTDSKRVGRENLLGFIDGGLRGAAIFELNLQAAASETDEALAAAFVSAPKFAGRNGLRALPQFVIRRFFAPLRAEVAIVKLIHFKGNPTAEVDAVGDVADGDFGFREAAPDGIPHAAADGAVELADRVAEGGEAESQDGHAEIFVVVGGILTAEGEEIAAADAEAAIGSGEIMIHEAGGEIVVAGGDGRMGGEDQAGRGENAGFGEGEMLRFHERADAFQSEESGMAFVHVIDSGVQAESFQSTNAADAEKDFLLNAHVEVAAIELRSDGAVLGTIGGDIGIEEIELNAAGGGAPNASGDLAIG